jgi:formylglycine-generating enzyme required for sulfatase activity
LKINNRKRSTLKQKFRFSVCSVFQKKQPILSRKEHAKMKIVLFFSFVFFAVVSARAQSRFPDDFVLIQGGEFTMGSPAPEPERGTDETPHRVTVSSFYIAKSEVTQRDYTVLMNKNPSEFQGDDLPVENVTWFDAIRYCNARSVKEKLMSAYVINGETVTWNRNANGYRLPTEAEWEYACRAGTSTPFHTGTTITDTQANCYNNYGYNNNSSGHVTGSYRKTTTAVNSFKANRWGLFDMHGNVGEWCWDWYGEYGTVKQTNPAGADSGTLRVNRGGGWNDFPKHIRAAYRAAAPPDNNSFNVGFRLARNVQ